MIAALLVAALAHGWVGVQDLGQRLVRWRVGLRWYVVVLVLPVALIGLAVALIPLSGGTALDWTKRPDLAPTSLTLALLILLPIGAPFSEEVGWRGFALPRLLAVRSALTATLILGVIWSLWHLPVVLDKPELRVPVPFHLAVIPLAVLFTWLFVHTGGSVLIAVLFHAWYDLVLGYTVAMIMPSDYARMWWLLFAVQSIAAIAVLVIERRRFTRKAPDPAPRHAGFLHHRISRFNSDPLQSSDGTPP